MERGLIKTSAGYIHYRATGNGKPIMLLHAATKSSAIFLELMEALSKGARVIAIDFPSYGMSDHIPGHPAIADYSKVVTEVMAGLGINKACFLGQALGAYVAGDLSVFYPDKVDRIILLNCPFYFSREYEKERHAGFKASTPTDNSGFPLPRTLEYVIEKDPGHIPANPTQSWMDRDNLSLVQASRDMWQGLDAVGEYDMNSTMERIPCPTLLIWGEHFFYLQFREEFTRRIKNHQVHVIKGGRFMPEIDFADEIARTVLKSLG